MDILNNFGINWIYLLEYTFNFAILLICLYIFAYKPVLRVLDQRRKIIEKSLEDAKEAANRKNESESEYKRILNDANNKANEIVKTAVKESEQIAARINDDAKKQAEKILNDAKGEISTQKEQMYKELKGEMYNLISSGISKVLSDSLDKEDQKKILEKAISHIEKDK